MTTDRNPRDTVLNARLALAIAALRANDYRAAEEILRWLVSNNDNRAETWRLLALSEFHRGDLNQAVVHAQRAVTAAPADALAWNVLGTVLDALGRWKDAVEAFGAACRLQPTSLKLWANWGKTLVEREQFEEAVRVLAHALTLGEHAASRKRLAHALVATGQLDEAERFYREQIAKYPADGDAWLALASLKENSLTMADGEKLRELESEPATSNEDRIAIQFTLSRHAEQNANFASAFDWLVKANLAERTRVTWDAAAFSRFVTEVLDAFDVPPASTTQRGEGLIFILGLPRTGSSFVEQSIAQCADVCAGGEISVLPDIVREESLRKGQPFPTWVAAATASDWERLGKRYLASIADRRRAAPVFTDKRCGNWVYIGAIARMLPGARIIYTQREAVDTCFGCFRQRFREGAQLFSYRLDECAAYWHDCERAMRTWQQRHRKMIRFQSHERLVSQRTSEIAALGEFCGLSLPHVQTDLSRGAIATASAAQLRSTRTAPRSWGAQYGSHLDPLRAALREAAES